MILTNMTKNVVVKRTGKTNSFGLLKKFSQKVRSSGIVQKVKSIRYTERKQSDYKKKKEALRKIAKTQVKERNLKLGKKPTR